MPFNMFGQNEDEDELNIAAQPPMGQPPAVEQPLPVGVEPSEEDAPSSSPANAAGAAPSDSNFQITNPLVKLWGDKYSDEARQKLIDEAPTTSFGGSLLTGLGAALGGKDASGAMEQYEKAPRDALNARLATFDKSRQGITDNFKSGLDVQKSIEDQKTLGDERDPNSKASKLAQEAALEMGIPPAMASTITADAFKKQGKIFEQIYQVKQNRLARSDARQASHDAKATTQQNQAVQSVTQLLESARGNPAAAQAEKDLYSAQKANTLMNMYGDPNQLSMPQVRLLASEVAKIASGGVPGAHELDGITPSSLTGKLSEITSKFTNKPTPANAAAFVKQYQDYTKGLTADAQKVIKEKYGRVIDVNRSRLGEENYKNLKANYIDRFEAQSEPSLASNPKDDHLAAKTWLDDPNNKKKNPKLYADVKAKYDSAVNQQASNGL